VEVRDVERFRGTLEGRFIGVTAAVAARGAVEMVVAVDVTDEVAVVATGAAPARAVYLRAMTTAIESAKRIVEKTQPVGVAFDSLWARACECDNLSFP
jgi:hypothetical protein